MGLIILSSQSCGEHKECSVRFFECNERPQSSDTREARRSHPKSAEFVADMITEDLSKLEVLIFEQGDEVAFRVGIWHVG
jgi:hypothetical protein